MSHYEEAHSVAFETFLKVYMTARKARVCACEVGVNVCFSSISVHVQACVSLCVGLGGVTGGRYAMSWLTRVLLSCSVLHD